MNTDELTMKYCEAATEEEKKSLVKDFVDKEKSKKAENQRIAQLAEGKITEAIMNDEQSEIILAVECPYCTNLESFTLYDDIQLFPTYPEEFMGFRCVCIKCKKDYKIGNKKIFKVLAESNLYE